MSSDESLFEEGFCVNMDVFYLSDYTDILYEIDTINSDDFDDTVEFLEQPVEIFLVFSMVFSDISSILFRTWSITSSTLIRSNPFQKLCSQNGIRWGTITTADIDKAYSERELHDLFQRWTVTFFDDIDVENSDVENKKSSGS